MMKKDILDRNIVSAEMAWLLKELGYKGWVSGYYHEGNEWEEAEGEDALTIIDYEYECIGNRSGFVNETSVYRAAAPTLIEAYQFLIEHGYNIDIVMRCSNDYPVQVIYHPHNGTPIDIEAKTLDNALDSTFNYITNSLLSRKSGQIGL